jgi:hypothetical protein
MTLWFDRAFGLHVPGQSTHGLKEGGSHE